MVGVGGAGDVGGSPELDGGVGAPRLLWFELAAGEGCWAWSMGVHPWVSLCIGISWPESMGKTLHSHLPLHSDPHG